MPPPGTQDTGGVVAPGQQPDHFANEEWFGVVRIDRSPRPAYGALRDAFASDGQARNRAQSIDPGAIPPGSGEPLVDRQKVQRHRTQTAEDAALP